MQSEVGVSVGRKGLVQPEVLRSAAGGSLFSHSLNTREGGQDISAHPPSPRVTPLEIYNENITPI